MSYKEAEIKLTKENIIDFIIKVSDEVKSESHIHYIYMPLPKDWIDNDRK